MECMYFYSSVASALRYVVSYCEPGLTHNLSRMADRLGGCCYNLSIPLQAISNPNNEQHQEAAWKQVGPLVQMLRRFYEYALDLETALCRLLSVLCSPEMSAVQHLASQQVNMQWRGGVRS